MIKSGCRKVSAPLRLCQLSLIQIWIRGKSGTQEAMNHHHLSGSRERSTAKTSSSQMLWTTSNVLSEIFPTVECPLFEERTALQTLSQVLHKHVLNIFAQKMQKEIIEIKRFLSTFQITLENALRTRQKSADIRRALQYTEKTVNNLHSRLKEISWVQNHLTQSP